MRNKYISGYQKLALGLLAIFLGTSNCFAITVLPIAGEYQPPGISGSFPDDSDFSWINHRFSSSHEPFGWRIGGGTDGGIIFGQAQGYEELTGELLMFNQLTGFYSIGNGITINQNNTIDMANLRMSQSGGIIDIGSGSGYSTLVPYVDDISLLDYRENGWSINEFGIYHLFYNTGGTCVECQMTIHLTGASAVPLPATFWLLISGGIGLFGMMRRRVI